MGDKIRREHPRPDFYRTDWENLNGVWEFSFDNPIFDREIVVPFCYQSQMSGINNQNRHDVIWYRRNFTIRQEELQKKCLLLHFEAVDYEAEVYLNDLLVGSHKGGYTAFYFDITEFATSENNCLSIKVMDSDSQMQPRGKQTFKAHNFGCWYTAVSGIWKTVWLEYVDRTYIKQAKFTPDIDHYTALCELYVNTNQVSTVKITAEVKIEGEENLVYQAMATCRNGYGKAVLSFHDYDIRTVEELFWSPEHPNLIEVKLEIINSGEIADTVNTYFGMRKISCEKGKILLNNAPLFQRLVLDQGYWQESLLTPPSDEAIEKDIALTLQMGFNGVRKHQKIEDRRYYYLADKMGLLVWGELPSTYEFNSAAQRNSLEEMVDFVESHYNHPSIITWVPINESWGIRNVIADQKQQNFAKAMYYVIKSFDETRIISANDGWEQITESDICAIHDYKLFPDNLDKYEQVVNVIDGAADQRMIYANGNSYQGQPVMITEYGGIAFAGASSQNVENWGYFGTVKNEEEFLARLEPVTRFIAESGKFNGYCYTQLTDVFQEVNGLLTMDRECKVDIGKLKEIFNLLP